MAAAPLSSRIAGFVATLRARGMTIGVGAEVDLGRATRHVDVMDREAVRDACRVTLAKSPEDLALLDDAFDAYWSSAPTIDIGFPEREVSVHLPGGEAAAGTVPRAAAATKARGYRFGVYSPDAPSTGHPLETVAVRRMAALRTGARRFRRLAATRPGRRRRPSDRGRIDVPATARRSVASGGEPIELRRRRPADRRAELVVLWDVSGSMREHDTDLFALVYALVRSSRRCRVFAFGTQLEDLTDRLRPVPYARAARRLGHALDVAGGGTRIGTCMRAFRRRFGHLVGPRTSVLVLSDGWDLGDARSIGGELEWLRRRAHLVAWVNPYARRPGFRPETAAMREVVQRVDLLLGPEDFERAGDPGVRSALR